MCVHVCVCVFETERETGPTNLNFFVHVHASVYVCVHARVHMSMYLCVCLTESDYGPTNLSFVCVCVSERERLCVLFSSLYLTPPVCLRSVCPVLPLVQSVLETQ